MTPTEIKIGLLRNGLKVKDLAQEFGCSPSHLWNVIRGARNSPKIRQKLFEVLFQSLKGSNDTDLVSIPVSIPEGGKK